MLRLLFVLALVAFAPIAHTQSTAPEQTAQAPSLTTDRDAALPKLDVDGDIKRLVEAIERTDKEIIASKFDDSALGFLRGTVESIMFEATQIAQKLRPRVADVRTELERLGPSPIAGGRPEAPTIADERARLTVVLLTLDGAVKTSELIWVRARQQLERITELRRDVFAQSITLRRPSPLSLTLWRDLRNDLPSVANTLKYIGNSWLEEASPKALQVGGVLVASLGLFLLLRLISTRWIVRIQSWKSSLSPSIYGAAISRTLLGITRTVAPVCSVMFLFVGLDNLDILHFWADRVLWAVVKAFAIYAVFSGIITAVLSPHATASGMLPLNSETLAGISRACRLLAGLYAADLALVEISRWLTLTVSANVAQTIVFNLLLACVCGWLLAMRFKRAETGSETSRLEPIWLKGAGWSVLFGIVTATFLGYLALGRFIAHQMIYSGAVLAACYLGMLCLRGVTRQSIGIDPSLTQQLETSFSLTPLRRGLIAFFVELSVTLALVLLALPFVLLQWGFSGGDVRDIYSSVFFGFDIGKTRINPVAIALAVLLFIALLVALRVLRGWLTDMLRSAAGMDEPSIASADALIRYAGTVVAAIIAVSYAGFDATTTGFMVIAMSVGVGFALQSVAELRARQVPSSPMPLGPPAQRRERGTKIFISYRRSDARHIAGRIFDRLSEEFGEGQIFFDVDSIPVGADFRTFIRGSIEESSVLIAVIGSDWVNRDWAGWRSPIDLRPPRPDFVEIELSLAIEAGVPIIPVLIDAIPMPPAAVLPSSLKNFPYLNASPVRAGRDFKSDMDLVVEAIRSMRDGVQKPQLAAPPVEPAPLEAPSTT